MMNTTNKMSYSVGLRYIVDPEEGRIYQSPFTQDKLLNRRLTKTLADRL